MASQKVITDIGPKKLRGELFREGKCPIYILQDGRFAAYWGGKWQIKKTLESLEKVIRSERKSVKVFTAEETYSFHDCAPQVVDIVALDGHWLVDKDGKRHRVRWSSLYAFDEKLVTELKALDAERVEAEKDLRERFKKLIKKAKRLFDEDLEEQLKEEPD